MASPVDFKLSLNGLSPIAEEGLQTKEVAKVIHRAGHILARTGTAIVRHQRVLMKRAACVICKKIAEEERRGIRRQKRQPLQASTPNFGSKKRDKRVPRSITGCASCKVSLCAKKSCWEAFYSSIDCSEKISGSA